MQTVPNEIADLVSRVAEDPEKTFRVSSTMVEASTMSPIKTTSLPPEGEQGPGSSNDLLCIQEDFRFDPFEGSGPARKRIFLNGILYILI